MGIEIICQQIEVCVKESVLFCKQAPSRNHPLLLLSGVGSNALGYDLSPEVSESDRVAFSFYFSHFFSYYYFVLSIFSFSAAIRWGLKLKLLYYQLDLQTVRLRNSLRFFWLPAITD